MAGTANKRRTARSHLPRQPHARNAMAQKPEPSSMSSSGQHTRLAATATCTSHGYKQAQSTQSEVPHSRHANTKDTIWPDFLDIGAQFPASPVAKDWPNDYVARFGRVAIGHQHIPLQQWAGIPEIRSPESGATLEQIDTVSIPSLIEDRGSNCFSGTSSSVDDLLPIDLELPPTLSVTWDYQDDPAYPWDCNLEFVSFDPFSVPPIHDFERGQGHKECASVVFPSFVPFLRGHCGRTANIIKKFEDEARHTIKRFEDDTRVCIEGGLLVTNAPAPLSLDCVSPQLAQLDADDLRHDQEMVAGVSDTNDTDQPQSTLLELAHRGVSHANSDRISVRSESPSHSKLPSTRDDPASSTNTASSASDYEWSTNSINSIGDDCWLRRVSEGRYDRFTYIQHMKTIIEIALRRFALWSVSKQRVCPNGPNDSPAQAASGEASNLGSSASITSHRPSRIKRQAPCRKRDNDEDEEEDEPRGGKRPKFTGAGEQRSFACPYFKLNPVKHHKCASLTLSRIRDVKQHLVRRHLQPLFCFICGLELENQTIQAEHIRAQTCTRLPWVTDPEGITPDQRAKFSKRVKKTDSEDDQWFSVWIIIFPNSSQPKSPFVCEPHAEAIEQVFRFARDNVKEVVEEVVSSSTTGQVGPEIKQYVADLTLDSVNQLMQVFTKRLAAVSNPPASTAHVVTGRSSEISDLPGTSVPDLVSEPAATISDRSMQPPPCIQGQHPMNNGGGKSTAHMTGYIAGEVPDLPAIGTGSGQVASELGPPGALHGALDSEHCYSQSFEDQMAAIENGREYESAMFAFDDMI